ncbi:ornithine decarboxylase, partial [Salmonella enterica]|nr:ornithine decarboxylase [Salmonella enterica]
FLVKKIGHLCDYILFDSAWVGYEQFIPMLNQCSPLLLNLTEESPGIIVTQSVHKQLAGFSQTSQIHKKDNHIKRTDRFCDHRRFNNAFMQHASTSPFYPLFTTLDVNAKIHDGRSGIHLWEDCVRVGIEARKMILATCKYVKPFIPEKVNQKEWAEYSSEEILKDSEFFRLSGKDDWHGFSGYEDNQYFLDPCKLLLTTPGMDLKTGAYSESGIPSILLAYFLREHGIVPEKSELNAIIFLLTPATSIDKINKLVTKIAQFEEHIDRNSPVSVVLPELYLRNKVTYQGYKIGDLCQEVHNLYREHELNGLLGDMFKSKFLPPVMITPYQANKLLIKGDVEFIRLEDAFQRIAAEAALPYPPGIVCIAPGERWEGAVFNYFMTIQIMVNKLADFAPDFHGVYILEEGNGIKYLYTYVVKD